MEYQNGQWPTWFLKQRMFFDFDEAEPEQSLDDARLEQDLATRRKIWTVWGSTRHLIRSQPRSWSSKKYSVLHAPHYPMLYTRATLSSYVFYIPTASITVKQL